jgi:hypothetical protein
MRKLNPLLIIIVLAGLSFNGFYFGVGQVSISINGVIDSDTTWTKVNSPYILDGNVLVSKGATLTIEAGTTVNLNSQSILVNGTLVAKGNSESQVTFHGTSFSSQIIFTEFSTAWNEQAGSGSIINKAYFNGTSIKIDKASPKITNSTFYNSLSIMIECGSPVISNNDIYGCQIEINDGSPIVTSNIIHGGHVLGLTEVMWITPITINGGSALISKNYIRGADVGAQIANGNTRIAGNTFEDCSTAIIADVGTIERNYIFNSTTAIKTGNAIIQNNTIVQVAYGISVQGSAPTIIYNNFLNTIGIYMSSSINIIAANNWWGTTNTSIIDKKIWDYNDDFSLGKVNYAPLLIEANPQAMPDPNAPILTPNKFPPITPDSTSYQNSTDTPDHSANQKTPKIDIYIIVIASLVVITAIAALAIETILIRRKKR